MQAGEKKKMGSVDFGIFGGTLNRQGCWDEISPALNHCLQLSPELERHSSTQCAPCVNCGALLEWWQLPACQCLGPVTLPMAWVPSAGPRWLLMPPPRPLAPPLRAPFPRRPPAPPHLPSAPRGGPPGVAEPSLLPGGSGGARCLPPALRYRRIRFLPSSPSSSGRRRLLLA
jgi:hypothetical protein